MVYRRSLRDKSEQIFYLVEALFKSHNRKDLFYFRILMKHSIYGNFFQSSNKYFVSLIPTVCFFTVCLLTGCGGGGGGGDSDFIGAAQVEISASPANIDTGDRMLVTVDINDVNESGIALKFKFPDGLSYVPSSSSLVIKDQSIDISPTINLKENNSVYMVYYLKNNLFGSDNRGSVQFFLEGVSAVVEGKLGVDADVDNPLIDNSVEFDPKDPNFVAESYVEVNVEG